MKGGVVALLLDLEIRSRTGGAALARRRDAPSVDALRQGGRAASPTASVQALAEEATGLELGAFFDRHVRGRDEVDAERLLAHRRAARSSADGDDDDDGDGGKHEPWLGVTTREDGDALVVATALDGGPAVQAGLYANDQLLALDGFRVEAGDAQGAPGGEAGRATRVRFTLFRRDELREVEVTLGEKPVEKLKIAPAERRRRRREGRVSGLARRAVETGRGVGRAVSRRCRGRGRRRAATGSSSAGTAGCRAVARAAVGS